MSVIHLRPVARAARVRRVRVVALRQPDPRLAGQVLPLLQKLAQAVRAAPEPATPSLEPPANA